MTLPCSPRIYVGPSLISDFNEASRLEWIVTNGLGGYASSTILNINTRKYHGLLVAAFNPPVERRLLLTKVDEEVSIRGNNFPFFSNEFRDVTYPDGYKRLMSFCLKPLPTFRYAVSGFFLKKEIFMPHQKNAVIIRYEALNALNDQAVIILKPLINSRHFFDTTDMHTHGLEFTQEPISNGFIIETQPYGNHLILSSTEGHYSPGKGIWIERIYFRVDDSRGESSIDDNYQPGTISVDVAPKERKTFYLFAAGGKMKDEAVTLYSTVFPSVEKSYEEELHRRHQLIREFYERNPEAKEEDWLSWLLLAADSFIVTRRSTGKRSVIAGYHWFEDWGRDSLISLPGITLVTGRFKDAEEILLTFKEYCKDGLIPNRFPDRMGDKPVYDSVDATLWFFNAILQYLKYTGNFDFVREEIWETLQSIVERLTRGTLFDIHLDADGLLMHGPRLTWMDVSIGGKPVTPREGKAVEIQALWYNALRIMELLSSKFNRPNDAQNYRLLAGKAWRSFHEKFWRDEGNHLYDVINRDKRDPSMRPNQIIAAFLDFPILDDFRSEKIVEAVWKKLWGTYGLKSLSDDDPRYVGKYVGDLYHRDIAYHNGTMWAWLLGPFITAFLKTKNHDEYWRRFAYENFLQPLFLEETYRTGLGTVSEIFDGDPPHLSRGCISQAWSVAEPLRAFIEDILLKRPLYERQVLDFGR